jgi:hypothetical protein
MSKLNAKSVWCDIDPLVVMLSLPMLDDFWWDSSLVLRQNTYRTKCTKKKVVRIKPWLASQATGPLVNYPLSWGDGADNGAVLQEPWRTSNTLVGWSQTCQKRVKLYISTICLNPLHVLYIYIQMLCCQSGFPTCPCASFSKQSHKEATQKKNKTVLVRLQIHRPPAVKPAMDMCVFRAATPELPLGPGDLSVGAWT